MILHVQYEMSLSILIKNTTQILLQIYDIDMDAHGWIELWCSTKPMCSISLCYHIRQIHPWSPVKNPSDWGDYLQLSILNRTTVIRKIQSGHLVTIVVLISRRGR